MCRDVAADDIRLTARTNSYRRTGENSRSPLVDGDLCFNKRFCAIALEKKEY